MKPWVIYTLSDPRGGGVRYVGVTHQTPRKRLSGHLSLARKGAKYHLAAWVRSLLAEGLTPVMDVVEQGAAGSWAEAEARWIKHHRDLGADLTNATDGGEGCPGHAVSTEARGKIAAARRGKPLSDDHKAKVAAGNRGKKMSPEAVAKTAAFWRGRKHTEETKAKIAAARQGKGHKPTKETLDKRAISLRAAWVRRKQEGWVASPLSAETKDKIRAARTGKKHTPEAKQKMSEAKRRLGAKPIVR